MAWKGIVKKAFTTDQFTDYVNGLTWTSWKPEFIVLHNTAAPSLAQRPDGFTKTHIEALESYYKNDRGWSAGPHLFIDDHVIWVFTPLTTSGTHSPSWNSKAIGIEMLGDYAKESFTTGRGAHVRENAIKAIAALSVKLSYAPDAWRFHNQDPKTDHDCPGKNCRADKTALVDMIRREMDFLRGKPRPVAIPKGTIPVAKTDWKDAFNT